MSFQTEARNAMIGQNQELAEQNYQTRCKVDELMRLGLYVVVYRCTAYCQITDATLPELAFNYEPAFSRWEANRKMESFLRYDGTALCGLEVWPKR